LGFVKKTRFKKKALAQKGGLPNGEICPPKAGAFRKRGYHTPSPRGGVFEKRKTRFF